MTVEYRLSRAIKKYGNEFNLAYLKEKPIVECRYMNIEPGDPINIIINKMLILDSAQSSLDGHAVNSKSDNFVYHEIEVEKLETDDLYCLKKDVNRFTNLSDILDRRKCKDYTVVCFKNNLKIVCFKKQWEEVILKNGGYKQLKYCTNIVDFEKKCGYLAGLINYSNIMIEHLGKDRGNLILINMYLLNKGVPLPITRSGIKARCDLFSKAAFETSLKSLQTSRENSERDNLNEHVSRLIFQQTPLIGTNFNYFKQISPKLCKNS